tara:strand:+ start:418 stop:876 length:459 start_codon:yes stop_codon:yes gene_type:complete
VIYAYTEKKTFNFDRLRYKTAKFKIPTYGVCSYTVKNPVGGYTGGKVYIKIAKLDQGGVTLYISSDGAVKDTTITSLTHDVYSIENGKEFTISAVPALNSYQTEFGFQYWNDGTKNPNASIWKLLAAHNEKIAAHLKTSDGSFSLTEHVKNN